MTSNQKNISFINIIKNDLIKNLTITIWYFFKFIQIDHSHIVDFISKFLQTINVIIAINFKFAQFFSNVVIARITRNFFEFINFSHQWAIKTIKIFHKIINKFFENIVTYRNSQFYRNFLFKNTTKNFFFRRNIFFSSKINNSITSNRRISIEINVFKILRFRDEYDFKIFAIKNRDEYDDFIVRRKFISLLIFNFFSFIHLKKKKKIIIFDIRKHRRKKHRKKNLFFRKSKIELKTIQKKIRFLIFIHNLKFVYRNVIIKHLRFFQ